MISANDELFAPRQNLILPQPATHEIGRFGHTGKVYDGWETRRRREPGFDWAIVRLGVPGIIHGVVVDTAFFKGNYPPYVSVEATSVEGYPDAEVVDRMPWTCLVEKSPCEGDTENYYRSTTRSAGLTSGSTSSPTAGWPGSGCTARWWSTRAT